MALVDLGRTMSDVKIRHIRETDFLVVLDGWNRALPYDRKDEPWFRSTIWPTPDDGVAWVAELDGRLAGLAAVSQGRLCGLFVRKGSRMRGVGSALLLEATVKLQERGAISLFASHVPRAFYEANGWSVSREYMSLRELLSATMESEPCKH